MNEPMIEAYQLETGYNAYDVLVDIYDPVTQGDIDECYGYDEYGDFCQGKIAGPTQPDNPYYMKGWLKRENDFFKYESWEKFCE